MWRPEVVKPSLIPKQFQTAWRRAMVTLSTVGYGDIVPQTTLGKMVSAVIMLMGYGIIAVPTGIVTVEMSRQRGRVSTQSCQYCCAENHHVGAQFCYACGEELNPREA